MTRINLVAVESLADQHLFAEWREIKMVPAALQRYLKTNDTRTMLNKVGLQYKLGTGHVSFFYDKMRFLTQRYKLLTDELLNRKYNIDISYSFSDYTDTIPIDFKIKEWAPSREEIQESITRISFRISEKPDWYKYYGESKPLEFYVSLMEK